MVGERVLAVERDKLPLRSWWSAASCRSTCSRNARNSTGVAPTTPKECRPPTRRDGSPRVALPAEVAVEAAEIGRRLEAPAVVFSTLRRDIDAAFALLPAELQREPLMRPYEPPMLRLGALLGEAVLHLDVDGAAERVEAEDRVAGPDVDAVDGAGGIRSG